MFDWNDLRHFLAVARHGSTLAAAKALKVSHSTVHRRVEELEKNVGRRLVKRHSTGYGLTELGHEMRAYAERVEDAVLAFERRLAASETTLVGVLRVTCPEALGSRLMRSAFLQKFNARYPSLEVEFVISDKILDLGQREADIAIRGTMRTDQNLFGRKIGDIPWAVYASQTYIERHGRVQSLEDMDHHAVISFGGEMADHHTVRWLQSVAPKAKVAARSNSLPALILAVKSGAGVAPLPVIVGENESELVRLLGPVIDLTTPFYLLMHNDLKTAPRVRAFVDFFIEELPEVRKILTMAIPAEADLKQSS